MTGWRWSIYAMIDVMRIDTMGEDRGYALDEDDFEFGIELANS